MFARCGVRAAFSEIGGGGSPGDSRGAASAEPRSRLGKDEGRSTRHSGHAVIMRHHQRVPRRRLRSSRSGGWLTSSPLLRSLLKRQPAPVDAFSMSISAPARDGSRGASSRAHARRRHLFRFPIGWKFLVLLATVVPSMLAISVVAAESLSNQKQELDRVYEDNLVSFK